MEREKTVDVIIPVYKPGPEWEKLLFMLQRQSRKPGRILVMNTGKKYWKPEWEEMAEHLEVRHLTPEEFDHGGTRDQAAGLSRADYLLFMTQDAVPADEFLIERLLEAIAQAPDVMAAYARQIPRPDCRLEERYTRQFNYPEQTV